MSKLNKGVRFFLELIVVAVSLFVFLIGIGQLERLIGLTGDKTQNYSFIMLVAHLMLVYVILNETVYRWLPMKFFRRKKFKSGQQVFLLLIAFVILVFVFIMTKVS